MLIKRRSSNQVTQLYFAFIQNLHKSYRTTHSYGSKLGQAEPEQILVEMGTVDTVENRYPKALPVETG